jgi:hypothetical protein
MFVGNKNLKPPCHVDELWVEEVSPLCLLAEFQAEEASPPCHVSKEKFQALKETKPLSPLERYLVCSRG